jgi:uncharacterized protein (TIGR02246 family)
MTDPALLQRIDRLESGLAIQQLPSRYAMAVDARDLDAFVALFVDDVDCGRYGKGRDALRRFIEPALRTFYRSQHQVCGQVVDFIDADHAKGQVYCRAEHEDGDRWIVMTICYFDRYERRDGRWYFARRSEKHWYSSDLLERPHGPDFQHWDRWAERKPELPQAFATWSRFWSASDDAALADITRAPTPQGTEDRS